MRYSLIMLLCVAGLMACGPDVIYQDSMDFGNAGWNYADSVAFEYAITDTSARYDLVLSVDHTEAFATQNFYVDLHTHLPDGRVLEQPLSLQLADKYGAWYGSCGSGECTLDISIQEDTRFTEPGEHQLVVSQYSRQDPLPEVTGIGFRIVKR